MELLHVYKGVKDNGDQHVEKEVGIVKTLDCYFLSVCERTIGPGINKLIRFTSKENDNIHVVNAELLCEVKKMRAEGFVGGWKE